MLPETHENSNYILLRIPIEIHLHNQGPQGICMDPARLPELLGLRDQDIECLRQAGVAHLPAPTPQPKKRIDYRPSGEPIPECWLKAPFQADPNLPDIRA